LKGIPRTALRALLHGCSTYSTLVFRASSDGIGTKLRTFVRSPGGRGGTEVVEEADVAEGPFGVADTASVEDQPEREPGPFLRRDHLAKVLLDLDRIPAVGQPDSVAEPVDVRVDGKPGHPEGDAEDDVGGLPATRLAA